MGGDRLFSVESFGKNTRIASSSKPGLFPDQPFSPIIPARHGIIPRRRGGVLHRTPRDAGEVSPGEPSRTIFRKKLKWNPENPAGNASCSRVGRQAQQWRHDSAPRPRSIPVSPRPSNPESSRIRAQGRISPHRHRTNLQQRIRRWHLTSQERYQTRRRVHNNQALEQRPGIRDRARGLRRQPQTARTEISRPLPHPLASPRSQRPELESSSPTVERWKNPRHRCQQLHNPSPNRAIGTVGYRPDGEPGRVQPLPLPETTPRLLREQQDPARSIQSTNTGREAQPSKNPADRQETQQDPSSGVDTLEPPTQPRNHTKISPGREDQGEQPSFRLQPHHRGHASTRLIRRELPQLLGPNKHSLMFPTQTR